MAATAPGPTDVTDNAWDSFTRRIDHMIETHREAAIRRARRALIAGIALGVTIGATIGATLGIAIATITAR